MKKVVLSLAFVALAFVSCKETAKEGEEMVDSAAVVVEEAAAPVVDSAAVVADSAAAVVEEAVEAAPAK